MDIETPADDSGVNENADISAGADDNADGSNAGESADTGAGEDTKKSSSANSINAGRKIFFLYPTPSTVNQVITELIQNEYEAYSAKDHTRLARSLKKYSDSIIFVNIDEKMPVTEWEKWINSVYTIAPDTKLGIFSSKNDEEFRDKFIKTHNISCGFQMLKNDMSKITEVILEMMNVMNVKGRRKYLRASAERDGNATINIPSGGDFINGIVKDISVVGISCVFEQDPVLSKNSLLKDVQIKLQSVLLNVETILFGSRSEAEEKIYVMLFTQRVGSEVRIKIRKYIQQSLQRKMDAEIN